MKIAIFNPYKKIYAAENTVDHCYEAIKNIDDLEVNIKSFCSTEEIIDFNPEFILSHSSHATKFCNIPTYVVFNESTNHRLKDDFQKRCYLTFDGYLTQSEVVVQSVKDLCYAYDKKCHILECFANTRPNNICNPPNLSNPKITYLGNNWEVKSGNSLGEKEARFSELFKYLSRESSSLELYGDPDGWDWLDNKSVIKGKVSFENPNALIDLYNKNGVGLALSSNEFYNEDLANNRIYEIVSSGAVCIADDLPFYKNIFGDSLLYITSRKEDEMAKQIIKHLKWIKNNKDQAIEKSKKAHDIFCKKLSSEVMLRKLISFHSLIQKKNYYSEGFTLSNKAKNPLVSVVVRSGGRSAATVSRTLDSIVNQSYSNFELVFVLYRENKELEELAKSYHDKFAKLIVATSPSSIRSTVILEGIGRATGNYIALLDDDDIWHKNHTSKILELFHEDTELDFIYSGKVYKKENGNFPIKKDINFASCTGSDLLFDIKSLTNLESSYCMGSFGRTDYNKMISLQYPIGPCFFVKKKSLTRKILDDPNLHYAEDLYFCALFYKSGLKFKWLPELTIQLNIHGSNSDDEIQDPAIHEIVRKRIRNRLSLDCNKNEIMHGTLATSIKLESIKKRNYRGLPLLWPVCKILLTIKKIFYVARI